MKFDPNIPNLRHRWQTHVRWLMFGALVSFFASIQTMAQAADKARLLATRTIERLVYGDAFDAKLRQRVWVGGREIIGVGQYEQAGGGTGRYIMELSMHDGDTKQSLRQLSDGRLTWTRTQIGAEIAIGRVDLGRIEEYEREQQYSPAKQPLATDSKALNASAVSTRNDQSNLNKSQPVPARYKVGGLAELIDSITRDYDLQLKRGTVDRQPVWILHGRLSESSKERINKASGRKSWAPLCPVEVRVAVTATADATGFGAGLPLRIEFWSEPMVNNDVPPSLKSADDPEKDSDAPRGRLISTLEIYDARRIKPQPEEYFRFERDDEQFTFINETKMYLDRL